MASPRRSSPVGRGPIAVLGPEGSFSAEAARRWSPRAPLRLCGSIYDAVEAAARGLVPRAIIPLENSVEGSVGEAMDLLREHSLPITAEVPLPVRYCLLSRGPVGGVREVASHPQALGQCRLWLHRHLPGVRLRETSSTAEAARRAARHGGTAAIAGQRAAVLYGLRVLRRDIQDSPENTTRFVVLGGGPPGPTGRDKTSILVTLQRDRPGALHEILGEFARRRINLTRIESRPAKRALGDYVFYIDCEGHREDPRVGAALAGIAGKAALRVLGSYPRA
ncbi:MAG: prephenate dehydratase [Euryarchaeota archaeon]|nr:prephenate dehydratase [Euryarchaeota archaeon]